jgi:hypothetical protein
MRLLKHFLDLHLPQVLSGCGGVKEEPGVLGGDVEKVALMMRMAYTREKAEVYPRPLS